MSNTKSVNGLWWASSSLAVDGSLDAVPNLPRQRRGTTSVCGPRGSGEETEEARGSAGVVGVVGSDAPT